MTGEGFAAPSVDLPLPRASRSPDP